MVCWQILQLLLEISSVHPKNMHHEKKTMGFKCSIHVLWNEFGDLAKMHFIYKGLIKWFFLCFAGNWYSIFLGGPGRQSSLVLPSPSQNYLRVFGVTPWCFLATFQKKHGNSSFTRIHIQAAKKHLIKGNAWFMGCGHIINRFWCACSSWPNRAKDLISVVPIKIVNKYKLHILHYKIAHSSSAVPVISLPTMRRSTAVCTAARFWHQASSGSIPTWSKQILKKWVHRR